MPDKHGRIFNFSAGPSALPTPVLEQAQAELLNYKGAGMSVMEVSHRSKIFDRVLEYAEERARSLMMLPDDYALMFLQGGASHQFAMAPLNFLQKESPVDMVHTGYWTKKAIQEVKSVGECRIAADGEKQGFLALPEVSEENFHSGSCYIHYCSNNTIYGTQWKRFVCPKSQRVIVDMSSDFLSRQIDFRQFDMIYAGAQKNLGPSGLCLVAMRKDFAETGRSDIPKFFQYRSHIEAGSRYNTPPTFAIYLASLVLEWIESQGGLEQVEQRNIEKSDILYKAIDESEFYSCPVKKEDRSAMNVVFRIQDGDEELEKRFLQEASQKGLDGLKGHRVLGGLRASLYNAQPKKAVEALVHFMQDFEKQNHSKTL